MLAGCWALGQALMCLGPALPPPHLRGPRPKAGAGGSSVRDPSATGRHGGGEAGWRKSGGPSAQVLGTWLMTLEHQGPAAALGDGQDGFPTD